MGYSVRTVDLSATFSDVALVEPGTRVGSIVITRMDSGALVRIRFGSQSLFYIPSVGTIDLTEDDAGNAAEGVYLQNDTAQPNVVVEFVVFPKR